ncbi:hypothetical protein IB237_15385 [Agrobacterium sp. AGB01]|uniref:hypothetical protein n=1 Tax=Agrobacterium sp. AGB01 TaxID=2769302 RepID=UPI00178337EA|nr:hypothetical protein [Agrobacterium sp. AGB01]MBD9388565.1 hypothetical protein [Agrobacterium sp. AGB01]
MFSADRLPTFIAFGDEKDPKSIFKIPTGDIGKIYPGVRFRGLDVEITNDPVTSKLRERLTWLNTPRGTEVFERDPPGKLRAARDKPLGFLITKSHFFGDGSR